MDLVPGFPIAIWSVVRSGHPPNCRKDFQIFVEANSFWPVTDFHGHELYIPYKNWLILLLKILMALSVLDFINVLFQVTLGWEVRLLWLGCKNLMKGTLMGGDLVIFWLMGEYHPNPPSMENIAAQKFSNPIRMLNPFTKKFSRKALSFEFVFLFGSSGLWLKPTE